MDSNDISGHAGALGRLCDSLGRGLTASRRLPGAGSDRSYWRLSLDDGSTLIGVYSPDAAVNRTFSSLAAMFASRGVNVPSVMAVSSDGHYMLETDLGDTSLFSMLRTPEGDRLVEECMRSLPVMQTVDRSLWRSMVMAAPFGRRQVLWDLNYFKYDFLKPAGVEFDEGSLEDDFSRFADRMEHCDPATLGFMMRDCQSRNVMVSDGRPWWIDFQGGMWGPALYDAVSFLWQAGAGFSRDFRMHNINVYAGEYERLTGVARRRLLADLPQVVVLRTLQVLGAYGLRGLVERKAHFLESIPRALANLGESLREGDLAPYPELRKVAERLCGLTRFTREERPRLKVSVFSFSYKKGYPDDFSGNGGGFMFDCRALPNPGRYERYKTMTGLDPEVVAFLEDKEEVERFISLAGGMVSPSVARYAERGFTSLQVGFGCTGGRHRSVYCAQRLAEAIGAGRSDVDVELVHREQGIVWKSGDRYLLRK